MDSLEKCHTSCKREQREEGGDSNAAKQEGTKGDSMYFVEMGRKEHREQQRAACWCKSARCPIAATSDEVFSESVRLSAGIG